MNLSLYERQFSFHSYFVCFDREYQDVFVPDSTLIYTKYISIVWINVGLQEWIPY